MLFDCGDCCDETEFFLVLFYLLDYFDLQFGDGEMFCEIVIRKRSVYEVAYLV